MSDNTDFFDGIGEGVGAPSSHLSNKGDFVQGEIVKMFKRDYIAFGEKLPEKRADGSNKEQLVIVLQTDLRGWAGVSKIPTVDPSDPNSAVKPPEADDGLRAVYVPEGKNIQFAIGRAVNAASQAAGTKVPFGVGGKLGVKIDNLKPTDKGNPLKEHAAVYTPPSAGDAFLSSAPAAPAQQQAPAQQALAQGSSFGGGDHGLNAPAQQAAPAQDPWASSTPATPTQEPPF